MLKLVCVHHSRYRQKCSSIIPGLLTRITFLFYSLALPIAATEEKGQGTMEGYNEDTTDIVEITQDWYLALILPLLLGFVVTLFATAIGYFSFKEDRLMNRYRTEGYTLYANIVMADIIRGNNGDRGQGPASGDVTTEYLLVVDYLQEIADNYTVRVRKQLKARSADVIRTRDYPKDAILPTDKNVIDDSGIRIVLSPSLEIDARKGHVTKTTKVRKSIIKTDSKTSLNATFTEDESLSCPNGSLIEFTSGINIVLDSLELYILPGLPKSGYPKIQVNEKIGLKYRVSTMLLILVNIMISAFCTYFASRSMIEVESMQQQLFVKRAILFYVGLILLEVPAISFFLDGTFEEALIAEYVENGEFMPACEGSTLSSGSDKVLVITSI